MSKKSGDAKDKANVARRQFIGLAGSFLGVTGASALLFSNSAEAAEIIPAKLLESLTAYATKVSKDKRDLAAFRKELNQVVTGLKNGQDLEKLCQTLVDGRQELSQIVKPYQSGGDIPSCALLIWGIFIVIIIILSKDAWQG